MNKLLTSAFVLIATSSAALAQSVLIPGGPTTGGTGKGATSVPEISALEGTAALAVVAAVVLLAWERRRRAA